MQLEMNGEKTEKIYIFFPLDWLVEHFSTRKQERVKSPWRRLYSQKIYTLQKTRWSIYLLIAKVCAGFSHLLVYFLNMHGTIEHFLLLIRTLKRNTLLSRNNKHTTLVLADSSLCFCKSDANGSQKKLVNDKDWMKWQLKAWKPSQSTHYHFFAYLCVCICVCVKFD